MKNNYLFVMCGEAFSGKSTLSKMLSERYQAKNIGRDTIYFSLEKLFLFEETPDEDDPSLWGNLWPIAVQGAKNHLLAGNSVVFDDTCLFAKQREELRAMAESIDVKSVLIYINTSSEIRKARKAENKINKTRHDVPSGWLENDSAKFERPDQYENPIVYNETSSFEDLAGQIEK
jgi:predicted kinase